MNGPTAPTPRILDSDPSTINYQPPTELERYELISQPSRRFGIARRELFKILGTGIIVLAASGPAAAGQEAGGQRRRGGGFGQPVPQDVGAWIHIGEDRGVTAFTGKAEVGQNIRTSLSQAVAEELRVPVASIRLQMADTDLCPFDMGTFGSRTTPTMNLLLRRAAAAARELLVDLAARQWQVDRATLTAADGSVRDAGGAHAATYAELSKGQKLTAAISAGEPEPPDQWKVAGTSVPKLDGRAFVTGVHQYTSDVKRLGMLFSKVLRPPSFGATLASLDTHAAEAIPGVQVVRDGDFVGVVAPDSYAAQLALDALKATWREKPQLAGKDLYAHLRSSAANGGDQGAHVQGSMEQGLRAADKTLKQTYTIAYIAHAPLEPRAAVAEWNGDKLTVWTGTQRPFGVRSELAQFFRIPESSVRVITPDTGSAYGGKHTGECAVDAARMAKVAGKPVRLVWTREEEFTWAYFRPAGVIDVTAGVTKDGKLVAWEFHNYNSGPSAIQTPYSVPNQRIQFHEADSPLRQGSYRGLAATANHFARETHMDMLADAAGMEPLEFRLKNLDDERLKAVFRAAADRFGWGKGAPPAGHGYGIAGGTEKGGYVATCAEVSVNRGGAPRVLRLVTAFECGAVVNPEQLRNQIEGAAMMGLGGALFEAIQLDNGKILNPRFSRYRVPRFGDAPRVEAVLVDWKDIPPAGAGETPIVAVAPAVGNALFRATGVRRHTMPLL